MIFTVMQWNGLRLYEHVLLKEKNDWFKCEWIVKQRVLDVDVDQIEPGEKLWRNTQQLKAKFCYAILVADRSEAGRRPAASWNLACY